MHARRTVPGVVAAACALLASCALLCVLAPRAGASATQQSILMDDQQLIYSTPAHTVYALEELASLGVSRVKVSVVWSLIAPNPYGKRRPSFDASDPSDYPYGAWARYDLIDRTARELGMSVYFMIAPPAPLWALPANQPNQGPPLGRSPNSSDLRDFVEAVGRRYNGSYPDPDPDTTPPTSSSSSAALLGIIHLPASSSTSGHGSVPLPAVNFWGIWNEPNERSWLNPWYRKLGGGRRELIQPSEYRGIVDAAWDGLQASGHRGDTILVGETANVGIWEPIPFVRALYCVGRTDQPLRGDSAAAVGCPNSGSRSGFVARNPGLFDGGGFAHHPYAFDVAPDRPYPDPTWVTLDNLGGFERLLNRIFGAYGKTPRGGVPVYLTEWGYKTDPPNPFAKTTQPEQAAWLDEGAYMTWRDPYVQALTQFLLVDSAPKAGTKKGSSAYWNTFQTGLIETNGTFKPSYEAFRLPIWVPDPRHGPRVTVWAQLRPADHAVDQYAVVEWRPAGSKRFEQLTEVQTASPEGFLLNHLDLTSPGRLKLAWLDPKGQVFYTRTVTIH